MNVILGGAKIHGEEETWDFGTGAGFYIDATEPGWKENYKMYSYVTEELPELVFKEYPIDSSRMSITGHSMGNLPLGYEH
jgi:S-formylglutathione hydrolase